MTRVFIAATAFLGMCAVTLSSVVGSAGAEVLAAELPTVQVYSNPG